ncbi:MAG: hypothetical protein M3N29_03475, partial [Chloroflexota bacterium]|nr:hypothetical protein [Chloroflexota bacterium]
ALAGGRGAAGSALVVVPERPAPAEPPPGVHMPGPSPWPFFAPIGLTVIFFGLILSPILIVIGLALSVIAAVGWLREASREYKSVESVGHAVPHTRDPEQAWPRRLVPVFGGLIALGIVIAALPIVGGWLEGLRPPVASPTPVAVPERPEVAARNAISFDTQTLLVPCCREFELVFNNQDVGVPHDVVITEGPQAATVYMDGETITGPDTATYQAPALEEGDYYFFCSIHPNMNGTVQARPETTEDLPPGPPVPPTPLPPQP